MSVNEELIEAAYAVLGVRPVDATENAGLIIFRYEWPGIPTHDGKVKLVKAGLAINVSELAYAPNSEELMAREAAALRDALRLEILAQMLGLEVPA